MNGRLEEDAQDLRSVSEVLRGNKEAFREIVDRYQGMILRMCTGFLGSAEEADEAAQEIFFRAFRSLRSFSLERRFLPWLYSIALNHLRSRYGALRKAAERVAPQDPEHSPDPRAADPEKAVIRAETRSAIRAAVASLPVVLREVVTLYYLEELSVDQVAATLGIGRESVKSRLLRARKKLRASLEGATGIGWLG